MNLSVNTPLIPRISPHLKGQGNETMVKSPHPGAIKDGENWLNISTLALAYPRGGGGEVQMTGALGKCPGIEVAQQYRPQHHHHHHRGLFAIVWASSFKAKPVSLAKVSGYVRGLFPLLGQDSQASSQPDFSGKPGMISGDLFVCLVPSFSEMKEIG